MPGEKNFTHFKADRVLIPQTETGGEAATHTQVVLDSTGGIAFVGTPQDVESWVRARQDEGAKFSVEQGGVLLPGMTDTHYHPGIYGMLELVNASDVSAARTRPQVEVIIKEQLRSERSQQSSGEPLLVLQWDSSVLGPFHAVDLDEIESARPVFVLDRSFHGGMGNTAAINLLKNYIRNTYGERSFPGRLRGKEFSEGYVILALELAESFHDVPAVQEKMEGQIDGYLAKGVTAMHEMEVASWNQLMGYLLMHQQWKEQKGSADSFPVRQLFLDERVLQRLVKESDRLMTAGLLTDDIRSIMGVKLLADGALGCETALLSEPYQGHKHKKGIIFNRLAEAEQAIRNVLRLGLDKVAVHAIGDAGIARAIEIAKRWQAAAQGKGVNPQFRFEHFELPQADTVRAAAELGAWVSMQSNFGLEDMVYTDRLGDRTRLLCPHADLVNEGVPMMLGSDGMPNSMLYVMWSAMHHPDPRHRLDMISAVTAASAAAGSYEGRGLRNVLQSGAKTDIVVATPQVLEALADGSGAEEYIAEALKPAAERREVPVRNQIQRLEGSITKVFAQGKMVYDAQKK